MFARQSALLFKLYRPLEVIKRSVDFVQVNRRFLCPLHSPDFMGCVVLRCGVSRVNTIGWSGRVWR